MNPLRRHSRIYYWLAVLVLALSVTQVNYVWAEPIQREPDSSPTSYLVYCKVYARGYEYSEYSSRQRLPHPKADDLEFKRLVERPLGLRLNQSQCNEFLDADESHQFFFALTDNHKWYRRSEFIHESELIPIERWTTRYIYNNWSLSHVGSELTTRSREHWLNLHEGYLNYALPNLRNGLMQFSDDGYITYFDDGGGRWRIMRHPYRPLLSSDLRPRFIVVDESGQYLPSGMPTPNAGPEFKYSCSLYDVDKYSCGFSPTPSARLDGVYFFGRINTFTAEFSPLRIEEDRITIVQRVTNGEPFEIPESKGSVQDSLFFYANFDDPVRPVYFAPGILLKDLKNPTFGRTPKKSDFVQYEVCLTDCPSDISWQYASRRGRDEAHP